MREQLDHLIACAERPNIDLRVLPFTAGAHANPTGGFTVFTMVSPYPDVAYAELLTGGVYIEAPAVERFAQACDRLRDATASPAESVELISAAMEELP